LGIIEQIEKDIPLDDNALNAFITEVNEYLNSITSDNIDALFKRKKDTITAKDTFEFFRSQERITNNKLIIQYLLSFIEKIPLENDISKEEINPFEQFKSFILYNTELLKEKDVRDAILKEYDLKGLLNDNNIWYYRGRIDVAHKEIIKLCNNALTANFSGYKSLFKSIQMLSQFWFVHRNENTKYIRRSDYYCYKLAAILIDKLNSNTKTLRE